MHMYYIYIRYYSVQCGGWVADYLSYLSMYMWFYVS